MISDLYSKEILIKNVMPVFLYYYNIEFQDGFSMTSHYHQHIEVMYVKKGCCEVIADGHKYRLEHGDFILLNNHVEHKLSVDKNMPCRVLCLEFQFDTARDKSNLLSDIYKNISDVRTLFLEAPPIIKLKDTEEIYSCLSEICKELDQNRQGGNISANCAFIQFMIKLSRLFVENEKLKENPSDRYIKEAIVYMNQNYDQEVSIEQVAQQVSLNISYFHKIFKKATGTTPMDYLNNIRLAKAKMLLERSDIAIIDICGFVGFNSRQYFTYVFKLSTGMTPREYRNKILTEKKLIKVNNQCSKNFENRIQ